MLWISIPQQIILRRNLDKYYTIIDFNEVDILQLLTSISVDIRIYLPSKVIFTEALRPR